MSYCEYVCTYIVQVTRYNVQGKVVMDRYIRYGRFGSIFMRRYRKWESNEERSVPTLAIQL